MSQTGIEPAQAEGRTSEDYSGVVGKGLLKRRLESEATAALHRTDHLLNADGEVGSVSPERPGRIDTRGPLRWNPGCSQAHRRERESRHCERRRVVS